MSTFITKPVVVEAVQISADMTSEQAPAWLVKALEDGVMAPAGEAGSSVLIATRTGSERADPGDWIVRASDGSFSACSAEEFGARYAAQGQPFDKLVSRFEAAVGGKERLANSRADPAIWVAAVEECDSAREALKREFCA